jgi:hypothetical protein
MTQRAFYQLKDYSATMPTGVYEGKMWRRHDGVYDRDFRAAGGTPEWLLCWYQNSKPGYCSTETRKILVIE